jgi:SsrA-binding protein
LRIKLSALTLFAGAKSKWYAISMKIIATNRRAKFDYEIQNKLWVGIVLTGAEVKSIKAAHISLKGSFVQILNGELVLINAHVSPYKFAKVEPHNETRTRKLLAHKKEINRLIGLKQSGLHLMPLAIGIERGLVKVEIGIGKPRKKYDKREQIKKREAERNIRNT